MENIMQINTQPIMVGARKYARIQEILKHIEKHLAKYLEQSQTFFVWFVVPHTGHEWKYMQVGEYLNVRIMKEISAGIFKQIDLKNLLIHNQGHLEITNDTGEGMFSREIHYEKLIDRIVEKIIKLTKEEKDCDTPFTECF